MSSNPLYPADDHGRGNAPGGSSHQHDDHGLPVAGQQASRNSHDDAALDLIRRKLAGLYEDEPDAKEELQEAMMPASARPPMSKHQQYMRSLHDSGKPMSEIQTAWHAYYQQLDATGKHEVWQEFYARSAESRQQPNRIQPRYETAAIAQQRQQESQAHEPDQATMPSDSQPRPANPMTAVRNPFYTDDSQTPAPESQPTPSATHPQPDSHSGTAAPVADAATTAATGIEQRPADDIRQDIRKTITSRGKLKAKHHLQSLAFGLGVGAVTVMIVLFSFFNEVVIAPFIQPSRNVSATPIIVGPDGVAPTKENQVIIPKINVQIPLDFQAKTTNEKEFEDALDRGVAHYPTTALPGQQGNASFFGHSSNNIFNPGQYKFAFVLLNELVPGDMFYLTYEGKVYSYQVYDKKVVPSNAVEILNPVADKKATAMLVTCDPPGTTINRLAVWGEQISPNPNENPAAAPQAPAQGQTETDTTQTDLPGNGPTLWRRLINAVTGNN